VGRPSGRGAGCDRRAGDLRARLAAVLVTVALGGCGSGDDEPARWGGPPRPDADGAIAVDGFAEHQDEVDEPWERTPLTVAAEFLRVDEREPTAATIDVDLAPEGATTATVTATFENLLDDSVRDARYTLDLERNDDGTWRLVVARYAQRCRPGRGHGDFSPEVCL
jgi:hypothetical protein